LYRRVGKQQVVSGVVIDGREREILLIEHGARYVRDRHPIADQSGPGHVALVGEVNDRRASLRQIVFFEVRPLANCSEEMFAILLCATFALLTSFKRS